MRDFPDLPSRRQHRRSSRQFLTITALLVGLLGCAEKVEPFNLSPAASMTLDLSITTGSNDAEERSNRQVTLNTVNFTSIDTRKRRNHNV